MGGECSDIREFLRKSMEKNKMEASRYLLSERKKKIDELAHNNGLPPIFQDKTLGNYDKSKNPKAYRAAVEFIEKFPSTKGILFTGFPGLGKSHLAAAIARELNQKLYSTYFGNIIDIISFIKSTYNKDSLLTEYETIKIMTQRIDLLIIDDLGKERDTEYNLYLLYQIINKLYENKKSIIITTNYGAFDLRERLGDRGHAIVSRICAMCTPIVMTGEDWRLKK